MWQLLKLKYHIDAKRYIYEEIHVLNMVMVNMYISMYIYKYIHVHLLV